MISEENKHSSSESGNEICSESRKLLFENQQLVPMWVSTKTAASILDITPNALRIRRCRGEIECQYLGSKPRYDVTYIRSLVQQKRASKRSR